MIELAALAGGGMPGGMNGGLPPPGGMNGGLPPGGMNGGVNRVDRGPHTNFGGGASGGGGGGSSSGGGGGSGAAQAAGGAVGDGVFSRHRAVSGVGGIGVIWTLTSA